MGVNHVRGVDCFSWLYSIFNVPLSFSLSLSLIVCCWGRQAGGQAFFVWYASVVVIVNVVFNVIAVVVVVNALVVVVAVVVVAVRLLSLLVVPLIFQ